MEKKSKNGKNCKEEVKSTKWKQRRIHEIQCGVSWCGCHARNRGGWIFASFGCIFNGTQEWISMGDLST